ncbi:hypothetical protein [Dictyobacter kobayashii]|uniref:Uncharacterized protein n=1 Tax=Dictyobacter kobayashii TaxID=2014872 RepID=A0A402AWV6_9CHLR|nr:hypothetical protein [Dictyobacter kobayashii]GCE23534.1 hypothetical protein KDK_73340 [Dictyobacter kobayashii]
MAHLRFMNPQNSKITGSLKRAQQLIRSQYVYLEEHPDLAPKNFRRLCKISQRFEALSRLHPQDVDEAELNRLLQELSSIIASMQQAA